MNKRMLPFVIVLLVLGFIFMIAQFVGRKNVAVKQGQVAYIIKSPFIFGNKHEFKGILVGPNSTGWKWRLFADATTDFRPITIKEDFIKGKQDKRILSVDKINIDLETAIILGYRNSPTSDTPNAEKFKVSMKEYFEHYGQGCWDMRYHERYRRFVRTRVGKETYASTKEKRDSLAAETKKFLDAILEGTPLYCIQVTFNNVNPPEEILTEEIRKRAVIVQRERMAQEDSLNIEREKVYNRLSERNRSFMLQQRNLEIMQKAIEGGQVTWGVIPAGTNIAVPVGGK